MSDPNALPIAGWYPDPENEAGDRWWNGATWSDHRRPRNAGPGWAPAAKASAKKKSPAEKSPAADPATAGTAGEADATPAIPVPRPAGTTSPATGTDVTGTPYSGQPAPAYTPYAPAYAPNYAPPQQMRNPIAFGGMLTSLIGLLFNWILFGAPGIVGAILSFVGLRRANRLISEGVTVGSGKGMAIGGIVAGLAGALLFNLFYFTYMAPFMFT